MSISAAVMGTVVHLLGKIRVIPRRMICILWAIPFVRMVVPVGVNSKFSLMSLIVKFTGKPVPVYEGVLDVSAMNHIMWAEAYFPITYKTRQMETVFDFAAIIWIIIAFALLIAMTIIYCVTMTELKDVRCLRGNVYISDKILSPAVYGVLHEKIVLPADYREQDLKYILMHENAHIRRKDNLWRILAVGAACIHWFNPFSWLFLRSFLESTELACDEAVLRKCKAEERKVYAAALLNCAESKSLYTSAFGGRKVRVRIEQILSYKRISVISAVAFSILAIAVACVLLTNAK